MGIKTITLTPNYQAMFSMFLKDFRIHSQNLDHFDFEAHEYYHAILASLSVAAHSITSTDDVSEIQNALLEAVEESRRQLERKE